jgi:hypothetical protein
MNTRRLRARLDRLEVVTTYTPEELESFREQLYVLCIHKNNGGLTKNQEAEYARLEIICRGMDIFKAPESVRQHFRKMAEACSKGGEEA